MSRHRLDPEAPFRAAGPMGRLVAQRLLGWREALEALAGAAGIGAVDFGPVGSRSAAFVAPGGAGEVGGRSASQLPAGRDAVRLAGTGLVVAALARPAVATMAGRVDARGLRVRLAQALLDSAREWHWRRLAAAAELRRALLPLLIAGAGRARLQAAARATAAAGALRPVEVEAILREEVALWLAGGAARRWR